MFEVLDETFYGLLAGEVLFALAGWVGWHRVRKTQQNPGVERVHDVT